MRTFYVECSAPFWLTAARELQRELGAVPVYWSALSPYREQIAAAYPEAIFHDVMDAKFAVAPEGLQLPRVPMDASMEEIWREEAQVLFDMLSRFDLNREFAFSQRRRYLRQCLFFWAALIEKLKPELVVFPDPPHAGHDWILRCLCRKRGIRTVMFDDTAVFVPFKHMLTYADHVEGDVRLRETYRKKLSSFAGGAVPLPEGYRKYLDVIRSNDYQAAKPEVEKQAQRDREARRSAQFREDDKRYLAFTFEKERRQALGFGRPDAGWLVRQWKELTAVNLRAAHWSKRGFRRAWLGAAWKQMAVRFEESYDRLPMSQTELELCTRWWWEQAPLRRQYYDSVAKPFDPARPYVYLSLPCQPERTSNPQGGLFCDPGYLVHTVAAAVPDGWHVYVKEHPNQLDPIFMGQTCRDPEFYSDVAALPNASWVPFTTVPFSLIDGAKAVVTVAGSSGWEAVVRGKPAVAVGAAWYRDCDGVFHSPSAEAVRRSFRTIAEGYRVDPAKVDLFVDALRESTWQGLSDPLPPEWIAAGLSEDENGRRLAAAAVRFLRGA